MKSSSTQGSTERTSRRSRWLGDGAIKKRTKKRVFDSSIWRTTPPDVQLRILSFLPHTSLCRFRSVSKSWRGAISTTTIATGRPWFISSGGDEFVLCNGYSWKRFDFINIRDAMTMSTAAGLVLATSHENARTSMLSVHNPFVPGSARLLVRLATLTGLWNCHDISFTGIQPLGVSSEGKQSFAAVFLTTGGAVKMHVFDSRSWSWVVQCANPASNRTPGEFMYAERVTRRNHQVLLENERLYYLLGTKDEFNTSSLMCASIWDPEHTFSTLATWTSLPFGMHLNPYQPEGNGPALFSSQGKLMLARLLPHPTCGSGAVGIVRLDEESRSWKEVVCFPLDPFPEKVRKANVRKGMSAWISAAGIPGSSKVALSFLESSWGCVFDLVDFTWKPSCSGFREFMPFQPSFLTI